MHSNVKLACPVAENVMLYPYPVSSEVPRSGAVKMQQGSLRVLRVLVAANPLLVDNQFTRGPAECEFCRGWPWLANFSIECAVILNGPIEEI